MATPRADSYSVASGGTVYGGLEQFSVNRVLDLIAAAPPNSWVKLNTNTFQSAWSPSDLRQAYPWTPGVVATESPRFLLSAWCSIGWDPNRSRLVLWGGGHANTSLNEVYTFDAKTGLWSCAFYGARSTTIPDILINRSADGNSSPVSSHTYCSNQYLPIIDRFYTHGGAAAGNGGFLWIWDGDTPVRSAGAYTLDLTLAGQGYVAGATGSNVKYGAYENTDVPGANAWKLRDWALRNPSFLSTGAGGPKMERIEVGTCYAVENGHDVLYWSGNGRMWRTEFVDDNPENDIVQLLGTCLNGISSNGQVAYDPLRRLIVQLNSRTPNTHLFALYDLNSNTSIWVDSASGDSHPDFKTNFGISTRCGFAYDPRLDAYVLWGAGRYPWLIRPPAGNAFTASGWSVEKVSMDTVTAAPPDVIPSNDWGIIGRFRYAPELRCCVGIEDVINGNVWALKLNGWVDPRN